MESFSETRNFMLSCLRLFSLFTQWNTRHIYATQWATAANSLRLHPICVQIRALNLQTQINIKWKIIITILLLLLKERKQVPGWTTSVLNSFIILILFAKRNNEQKKNPNFRYKHFMYHRACSCIANCFKSLYLYWMRKFKIASIESVSQGFGCGGRTLWNQSLHPFQIFQISPFYHYYYFYPFPLHNFSGGVFNFDIQPQHNIKR